MALKGVVGCSFGAELNGLSNTFKRESFEGWRLEEFISEQGNKGGCLLLVPHLETHVDFFSLILLY